MSRFVPGGSKCSRVPRRRGAGRWLSMVLLASAGFAGAVEPEWTNIGPEEQWIPTIALALADHPNRSAARVVLYAVTSRSGVLRSSDQGATWVAVNNGLVDLNIGAIALSQRHVSSAGPITRYETVIYLATPSGIFRTSDDGANWTAVSALIASRLAADAAGDLYATSGGLTTGVLKSVDRGASWVPINPSPEPFGPPRMVTFDSTLRRNLYLAWGSTLYGSTNGGDSWTNLNPFWRPLLGFDASVVRTDPYSGNIYATGWDRIGAKPPEPVFVLSKDDGVTWTDFRHFCVTDFAFPDSSTVLAAVPAGWCLGGVAQSSDGGATWRAANNGFPDEAGTLAFGVNQLLTDPTSPGTVYAATTQGIFRSGPAPRTGLPRVVPKREGLSSPD